MNIYISCHHPEPANELAAALETAGIDVYTLGGVENGMLWHPDVTHARDIAHLLELLS